MVKGDGLYYKPGGAAIFSSTKPGSASKDVVIDPGTQIKDPEISSKPWSLWGETNDFPKERIDLLRKNTVGKRALEIRTATHVGTGVDTFNWAIDANKKIKMPVIDEAVDTWLENTEANLVLSKAALDLETYYSAFIGFTWNEPGTEIIAINHYPASLCRLGKKNSQGRVEYVYISAKWPSPTDAEVEKVPTYDPFNPTKNPHFILHVTYPTMENNIYYPLATWDVVVQNGWLEISTMVPELKKAILENAAFIRYHIQIPWSYWEMRFPGFNDKEEAEQDQIMNKKFDQINDQLFKREKAGKTLFTFFDTHEETGKEYAGWKITPIDNKLSENILTVDSISANTESLVAFGVAAPLLGVIPGGSEAGSGSNIKEHYQVLQTQMFLYRINTLRIFYLVKKLNGWDAKLQFDIGNSDFAVPTGSGKQPTKTNE